MNDFIICRKLVLYHSSKSVTSLNNIKFARMSCTHTSFLNLIFFLYVFFASGHRYNTCVISIASGIAAASFLLMAFARADLVGFRKIYFIFMSSKTSQLEIPVGLMKSQNIPNAFEHALMNKATSQVVNAQESIKQSTHFVTDS